MKIKRTYKQRKRRAIKTLKQYRNPDGTQKETSIERRIRVLLDSMGLYYVQEKKLTWKNKNRYFDFFVTDGLNYSFLIENDGDYWHATEYTEGIMKYKDLTAVQKKNLRNDKFKTNMAKELGIPLLRFTESEIKNNINYCKECILQMIQ